MKSKDRLNKFFTVAAISSALVPGATPPTRMFPEENSRPHWDDQQCLDWPVSIPGIGMGPAEKNPGIFIQKSGGFYRAFIKMTFAPEKGETFEHLYESVKKLMLDGATYPSWVLPGINQRPGGDSYFVLVNGMYVQARVPGKHFYLTGPYAFKILWFQRDGMSTIELRRDEVKSPPCDLFAEFLKDQNLNNSILFDRAVYRMAPRPEIIRMLIAEVYFLPRKKENRVELRMRLVAEPSPLIYQLMPESMMRGDVELRGRRIFQNLVDLRKTLTESKASTSLSTTPLKSADPAKKARKH